MSSTLCRRIPRVSTALLHHHHNYVIQVSTRPFHVSSTLYAKSKKKKKKIVTEQPSKTESIIKTTSTEIESSKNPINNNNHLVTPDHYRAFIKDLLLYRKESLTPLLTAIQEERRSLAQQMKELDEKIEKLNFIREDIRLLVEKAKEEENKNMTRVLNSLLDHNNNNNNNNNNYSKSKSDRKEVGNNNKLSF